MLKIVTVPELPFHRCRTEAILTIHDAGSLNARKLPKSSECPECWLALGVSHVRFWRFCLDFDAHRLDLQFYVYILSNYYLNVDRNLGFQLLMGRFGLLRGGYFGHREDYRVNRFLILFRSWMSPWVNFIFFMLCGIFWQFSGTCASKYLKSCTFIVPCTFWARICCQLHEFSHFRRFSKSHVTNLFGGHVASTNFSVFKYPWKSGEKLFRDQF